MKHRRPYPKRGTRRTRRRAKPHSRRKTVVRRRKIGRARVGDLGGTAQVLLIGGLAVGGYFLYQALAGPGTPTANSASASVGPDLASQISQGSGPNYDATQYASWADAIYSAASHWGEWFSDSSTVLSIMDSMDNLADVYSLIQAFGTRSYSWYAGSSSYSLPGFIQAAFSSGAIASFNQQLSYNGVDYTWQ